MPNRYGVVDYLQGKAIESRTGIAGSPYAVAVVWISGGDNARSVLKYSWHEAAAIAWIKAEGRRWQRRGYFPRGQFAIERTEQLQLAGCDRCRGELHYIHAAVTPAAAHSPRTAADIRDGDMVAGCAVTVAREGETVAVTGRGAGGAFAFTVRRPAAAPIEEVETYARAAISWSELARR